MEFAHEGPDPQQELRRLVEIGRIAAVRIKVQIMQRRGHDVVGRIEQVNAAVLEFRYLVGIEDVVPGVDHGIGTEDRLYIFHVIADAGRAPHVVGGVLIARIVDGQLLGNFRPGRSEVRQFRLVELLENAGRYLARQEVGARHDDIVAGLTGQQFCFQRIVGIIGVEAHRNAGFLGETVEYRGILIVRPIVVIDDALFRQRRLSERPQRRAGKRENNSGANPERFHVSVGRPAAFHANIPPARWDP